MRETVPPHRCVQKEWMRKGTALPRCCIGKNGQGGTALLIIALEKNEQGGLSPSLSWHCVGKERTRRETTPPCHHVGKEQMRGTAPCHRSVGTERRRGCSPPYRHVGKETMRGTTLLVVALRWKRMDKEGDNPSLSSCWKRTDEEGDRPSLSSCWNRTEEGDSLSSPSRRAAGPIGLC
jgi:hypothetical protein